MIPKLKTFLHIMRSTKNWFPIFLFRNHIIDKCEAHFRNGVVFSVLRETWQDYIDRAYLFSQLPDVEIVESHIKFTYWGRKLDFHFGKYGFGIIQEIFAGDPYKDFLKFVNPRGKDVVDVGAALGDTAIYFLLHGAQCVHAFEAFPDFFHLAKENIVVNGFSDSCNVSLAVVGKAPGNIIIDPDSKSMFGAKTKKFSSGETVPIITLESIVTRHDIRNGFLKMDVEGYEYDIILNTTVEILQRFSDILIEYHYGFKKIEDYLKNAGFLCRHTGPTNVFMPQYEGDFKNMQTGHIIAKRLDTK